LALLPAPALAQGPSNVGVVTTLTGQATVARVSLPQPLPLRFKDDVFIQDRISTSEKSIVRVLLGGKALVTVRELSVLTVTEEMGRSTVDLGSGKIAVGVARQRMRPGEAIEIRTPNIVAAVRGTVLVVEIIQASASSNGGPTPPTTNVHVIHGLVDVFPAGSPGAPPVQVGTLQSYSQIGGASGTMRNLSREAADALFSDLRSDPQFAQGPGEFMDYMQYRELERAAALAHAILPDVESRGGGRNTGGTDQDDLRVNENRDACSQGACTPSSGGEGGAGAKSGKALFTLTSANKNFSPNFYSVANTANVSLSQPLLETTASTLTVNSNLIDVKGTLAANDAVNPFVFLDPTTLNTGSLVGLSGGGTFSAAATVVKDVGGTITATGSLLDITGNGSTATLAGSLLDGDGTTVTAQSLAKVNAGLLAASAPLLSLTGRSAFTSAVDAVDLASVNNATKFASLARLDGSTFTVKTGAALNLTAGSVVSVSGDLFVLANGSTLAILNGPLISLSGNSSLNITGALINFVGTGNTLTVSNNLCHGTCAIIQGVPVFIVGGGSITLTNPIRNLTGNTIIYSPSAALISLSGAASQVTVQGK
jgi:hypothetical protein